MSRPHSITIIGWVFIAVGVAALVHHLMPPIVELQDHRVRDFALMTGTQALAIVAGVLLLRGSDWGRWLLVVWLAEHVVISLLHPLTELIVHCALFVVVVYFLFRPRASAYLRGARA